MTETIFANAQLILPTEIVHGALVICDGRITAIDTGRNVPTAAVDCEGDYIAPGLIELHTDNLERHIRPRPKVDWPHAAAIIAHDRELASVGITTVFDAIRVGSILSTGHGRYPKYARGLADEILAARDAGLLKISHHIHLRAEICSETLLEELDTFDAEDRIGLVSLMDHTPGQRQFSDLNKFEFYVRGKYGFEKEEFQDYIAFLMDLQARIQKPHEAGAVAAARRYGAVLASHDDTTPEQVAVSAGYGIGIAEFPTTVEAAHACHDAGIGVIMGAPNVVRGGSHSGNVAATDLAALDRLDILSSDYVPAALLMGAVQLGDGWNDLARGIGTVTEAPARYLGLSDRGRLEVGLRADLIRFRRVGGAPAVIETWSNGKRVA